MNRTRNALLALALIGVFAAPFLADAPEARADDESKELKKARKDVKKNMKRLLKASEELEKTKERRRTTSYKETEKLEALAEQIDQIRSVCFDQLQKVREADDEKAAEYLFEFATEVPDHDLYERLVDELYRFERKESIDWMVEVLGEKESRKNRETLWKHKILAATALAGVEGDDISAAFAEILEKGTNPLVVNVVVEKSRERESPVVIKALIELLGRVEAQGGWEYFKVRQVLTALTGEDFFTKEKWDTYWAKVENGWDPTKKGETQEAATRERGAGAETIPTFFGSEIESNRLMFVIDSSGSMQMTDKPSDWEGTDEEFRTADPDSEAVKATKRMNRAKRELCNAIQALQETQKFNVIDFDSGARKWQENLVPATPANKQAAVEWVDGSVVDQGGTYTDQAIEKAFSDPEVDTIYLLSDGAPYEKVGNPAPREEWPKDANGKVDENQPVAGEQQVLFAKEMIDEILGFVRFENRFRRVKIYTFGMDGPGVWHKKWPQPRPMTLPTDSRWLSTLSNFMRELAAITGGEYRSI